MKKINFTAYLSAIALAALMSACSEGNPEPTDTIPLPENSVSVQTENLTITEYIETTSAAVSKTKNNADTSEAAAEEYSTSFAPLTEDVQTLAETEETYEQTEWETWEDIPMTDTDLAEDYGENTFSIIASSVGENGFTGIIGQDTFFAARLDEVSVGIPEGSPKIVYGAELLVTLTEGAEVMETYPVQISAENVEHIEVIRYPEYQGELLSDE